MAVTTDKPCEACGRQAVVYIDAKAVWICNFCGHVQEQPPLEPIGQDLTDYLDKHQPADVDGYVVAVGDPFNGMSLYGLFEHINDAIHYAEALRHENEWMIVTVHKP